MKCSIEFNHYQIYEIFIALMFEQYRDENYVANEMNLKKMFRFVFVINNY